MTIESSDIETLAGRPRKLVGDEGSIEEKSVDELIKADTYSKAASATAPPFGLRVAKAKPFGPVQ